jgi:hypothetical protein
LITALKGLSHYILATANSDASRTIYIETR